MPRRKPPLVSEEIYHVYGRSVAQHPIFRNKRARNIFTNLLEYYRFSKLPIRYSHYTRLNRIEKIKVSSRLYKRKKFLVDIYAFCLMPNHYHLLLKQTYDNGIMNFIRLIQNSYARYLNVKTNRFGSLFQSPFKAVRIETDEQLIHVARYIHLNPLTNYLLKDINELKLYEWNSYIDYVVKTPRKFIDTTFIMKFFENKERFKKFTQDNLDYQRRLERIKHLTLD